MSSFRKQAALFSLAAAAATTAQADEATTKHNRLVATAVTEAATLPLLRLALKQRLTYNSAASGEATATATEATAPQNSAPVQANTPVEGQGRRHPCDNGPFIPTVNYDYY